MKTIFALALLWCLGEATYVFRGIPIDSEVYGDEPKPCCQPDTSELTFGIKYAAVFSGYPVTVNIGGKSAANWPEGKFGSVTFTTMPDGATDMTQMIQLMKENTVYMIHNGNCTKSPIPADMKEEQCIPADAKFASSYYFGDKALFVNEWMLSLDNQYGGLSGDMLIGATDKCIPTSLNFEGVQRHEGGPEKVPTLLSGGYVNYTSTVSDEKFWFEPPAICPTDYTTTAEKAFGYLHPMVQAVLKTKGRLGF